MIKWTFPEIENPPNGFVKPFGGFASGDPYGNRKSFRDFRIFMRIVEFRMIEPFAAAYSKCVFRNFLYVFAGIMIK